jgi:hypothetical protein
MAAKKAKKAQRFIVACCKPCQRIFEMTGTARQLRHERALKCPTCKQGLSIVMEGERV